MEKINNRKELINMCDMLQGNLNRICVSNNIHEIDEQYDYARKRLAAIYAYRYQITKTEQK